LGVFVAAGEVGEFFLHPVITLNAKTTAKTKNKIAFFISASPLTMFVL
jgi:hypothetical protein